MREHGELKRVSLVYGEAIRRIDANEDLDPKSIMDSAKIIRRFGFEKMVDEVTAVEKQLSIYELSQSHRSRFLIEAKLSLVSR